MAKKICILLCILLLVSFQLAAQAFGIKGSFMGGGAFAFPTAAYLQVKDGPVARTSGFYQGDVEFFDYVLDTSSGKTLEAALGLSLGYTSQSLPYGNSILRDYTTKGLCFRVSYALDSITDLGLRLRVLEGYFPASKSKFNLLEYEVVPSFRVIDTKYLDGALLTPLTVSQKADTLTVRLSLGVSLWLGVEEMKK